MVQRENRMFNIPLEKNVYSLKSESRVIIQYFQMNLNVYSFDGEKLLNTHMVMYVINIIVLRMIE